MVFTIVFHYMVSFVNIPTLIYKGEVCVVHNNDIDIWPYFEAQGPIRDLRYVNIVKLW